MRRKKCLFVLLLALLSVLVTLPAFAETTFKWGSYLRIRHEYWNDWSDYTANNPDDRNFFRFKSSLWGQAQLDKNSTLYAKLTNENRAHMARGRGAVTATSNAMDKNWHYDIDEVLFDNLYLDLKNLFSYPVDMRIGRQDLIGQYGEGFLISDGTPQDGSRTTFFDAIKTTWRIDKKNALDFIYLQNDKTEEKLPRINRNDGMRKDTPDEQALNLSDEVGYIVYLKSDPFKALHLENYYIHKTEEPIPGKKFNVRSNRVDSFGTYAKYTFGQYSIKGQFAYQNGQYGENEATGDSVDREGFGGYTFLTGTYNKWLFKPTFNVGYMYLSGDDPSTSKIEAWNPLFSRWPVMSDIYSELYYLSYNTEGSALGYWTNLQIYKTGVVLIPTKKTKFGLAYYYLRANEPQAGTYFTNAEKQRGNLFTGKLDYAINKNISAFFQGEYFIPGDFYKSTSRSTGVFLRTQLEMKY